MTKQSRTEFTEKLEKIRKRANKFNATELWNDDFINSCIEYEYTHPKLYLYDLVRQYELERGKLDSENYPINITVKELKNMIDVVIKKVSE